MLVGGLDLSGAAAALVDAAPILVFLFALFVFAVALEDAGALDHVAQWFVGRARSPRDLPLVLFLGFGLVSGLLVNDALALLGVPLLLTVARREGLPVPPLLLTLAFSVTVGSVLTPLGNPQNLLVSLSSGLTSPVTTFLRYLLLPTCLNLLLGGLFLRYAFRRHLPDRWKAPAPPRALLPGGPWGPRLRRHPVLLIFPATMGLIVLADLAADLFGRPTWPSYGIAAVGALAVLATTPRRARVLVRVDWTILILFAGLFVVVASAVAGGLVTALESYLPLPAAGGGVAPLLLPLAGSSLVGPQLVSNVPWVALQIPLLHQLGYGANAPLAWVTLAATSTLAGNLTFLGAASNLIVVDSAERAGVRLPLVEFVRYGLPLTALTLTTLLACLWVGL